MPVYPGAFLISADSGAEHFQHVGQLTGKIGGRGVAGLVGFFDELAGSAVR
jgi:hypothetical protein